MIILVLCLTVQNLFNIANYYMQTLKLTNFLVCITFLGCVGEESWEVFEPGFFFTFLFMLVMLNQDIVLGHSERHRIAHDYISMRIIL